jgi:hypothetical protein
LALDFMADLFSEFAEMVQRKLKWMQAREDQLGEHASLLRDFKAAGDAKTALSLMDKLDALGLSIVSMKPLAFAGQARQAEFMAAAQYADEWVRKTTKTGGVSSFRAFYVCGAGGSSPCNTITSSKVWHRHNPSTTSTAQSWYCPACGAGFKARFGMMVQIVKFLGTDQEEDFACRAEIPPKEVEDLRAMYLEGKLRPSSPEELYSAIPTTLPSVSSGVFRKARPQEIYYPSPDSGNDPTHGVYKVVDSGVFESLPKFSWWQIFNFCG